MLKLNFIFGKSVRPLAFSLVTASSLMALLSPSYAMDAPKVTSPKSGNTQQDLGSLSQTLSRIIAEAKAVNDAVQKETAMMEKADELMDVLNEQNAPDEEIQVVLDEWQEAKTKLNSLRIAVKLVDAKMQVVQQQILSKAEENIYQSSTYLNAFNNKEVTTENMWDAESNMGFAAVHKIAASDALTVVRENHQFHSDKIKNYLLLLTTQENMMNAELAKTKNMLRALQTPLKPSTMSAAQVVPVVTAKVEEVKPVSAPTPVGRAQPTPPLPAPPPVVPVPVQGVAISRGLLPPPVGVHHVFTRPEEKAAAEAKAKARAIAEAKVADEANAQLAAHQKWMDEQAKQVQAQAEQAQAQAQAEFRKAEENKLTRKLPSTPGASQKVIKPVAQVQPPLPKNENDSSEMAKLVNDLGALLGKNKGTKEQNNVEEREIEKKAICVGGAVNQRKAMLNAMLNSKGPVQSTKSERPEDAPVVQPVPFVAMKKGTPPPPPGVPTKQKVVAKPVNTSEVVAPLRKFPHNPVQVMGTGVMNAMEEHFKLKNVNYAENDDDEWSADE